MTKQNLYCYARNAVILGYFLAYGLILFRVGVPTVDITLIFAPLYLVFVGLFWLGIVVALYAVLKGRVFVTKSVNMLDILAAVVMLLGIVSLIGNIMSL